MYKNVSVAKCEFFNAGGSVKDRIGLRMVEDALASPLASLAWTCAALVPLTVGAAIVVDGDDVGTVTSVADGVGLAYVKRAVESFPASAESGGGSVEIRELPLV